MLQITADVLVSDIIIGLTLAKSIAHTNTNILLKSTANTETNTFVTILFTLYYIQRRSLFSAIIY